MEYQLPIGGQNGVYVPGVRPHLFDPCALRVVASDGADGDAAGGSAVDGNDRLLRVRHDCDLATRTDSEGKVFDLG